MFKVVPVVDDGSSSRVAVGSYPAGIVGNSPVAAHQTRNSSTRVLCNVPPEDCVGCSGSAGFGSAPVSHMYMQCCTVVVVAVDASSASVWCTKLQCWQPAQLLC